MLLFLLASLAYGQRPQAAWFESPQTVVWGVDPLIRRDSTDEPGWVKFVSLFNDYAPPIFFDSTPCPEWEYSGCSHFDWHADYLKTVYDYTNPARWGMPSPNATERNMVIGAVYFPALNPQLSGPKEVGIQIFGDADIHPTFLSQILWKLRKGILEEGQVGARNDIGYFFMPNHEQYLHFAGPHPSNTEESLGAVDFHVSSLDRWIKDPIVYSPGAAVGRLVHVQGDQVMSAFNGGMLLPTDILLSDTVPAFLPPVAGLLVLSRCSPAHVTVARARAFGIPMAYLPTERLADPIIMKAQALQKQFPEITFRGRRLLWEDTLRGYAESSPEVFFGAERRLGAPGFVKLQEVSETLSKTIANQLPTPRRDIMPQRQAEYGLNVLELNMSMVGQFGGESARQGAVMKALDQGNSLIGAFALSLSVWKDFSESQRMASGRTLAGEIAHHLAPFMDWPLSAAQQKALIEALDGVRALLISREVSWAPWLKQRVLDSILNSYLFDEYLPLTLRPSSNVDLPSPAFYHTATGCLADDWNVDSPYDPSLCDERGAARQMSVLGSVQHIWASFYTLEAFSERRITQLDEASCGMGVLLHHSTDVGRETSGSCALTAEYLSSTLQRNLHCVSQTGERYSVLEHPWYVSAEEMKTPVSRDETREWNPILPVLSFRSSLITVPAQIFDNEQYDELTWLVMKASNSIRDHYSLPNNIFPDSATESELERGRAWKPTRLVVDWVQLPPGMSAGAPQGGFIVLQAREEPMAQHGQVTPFLLQSEETLQTQQAGGQGSVDETHQLKSMITLTTRSMELTDEILQSTSLYETITLSTLSSGGCSVEEWGTVQVQRLPQFSHTVKADQSGVATVDTWQDADGTRTFILTTPAIRLTLLPGQTRFVVQGDWSSARTLEVIYNSKSPAQFASGQVLFSALAQRPAFQWLSDKRTATAMLGDGDDAREVTVEVALELPAAPSSVIAKILWSPELLQWGPVRVTGLTDMPLEIASWWALSYKSLRGHSADHIIIDPFIDANTTQVQKDQLVGLGVRFLSLVYSTSSQETEVTTIGPDKMIGGTCAASTTEGTNGCARGSMASFVIRQGKQCIQRRDDGLKLVQCSKGKLNWTLIRKGAKGMEILHTDAGLALQLSLEGDKEKLSSELFDIQDGQLRLASSCLTASGSDVRLEKCEGKATQTWQVQLSPKWQF